ncbi:addiction module protein [Prosthecomicrobium hirschii]|uniref:Addiction module protein n=1 Tax=Prosthecodimorpha hirschii TaxID=665126 RepID=A0A0P6VTH4_9HYPH|nr:type II toxin-antitoxin system RelE/ParE family toxin [Prosthecomicrobium hirschii]KPL54557.1 addiction module protein [Prosthecomicrobium hirschii]TPQ52155.1 addiction module protein [Prosthecomicrobium hirschii]
MEILFFVDEDGRKPFAIWRRGLDPAARIRVDRMLERLASGNLASLKGVGAGVLEARIDWGPGYRLYMGRDGERLLILLEGGTKSRQSDDIATAKKRWAMYKRQKGQGDD